MIAGPTFVLMTVVFAWTSGLDRQRIIMLGNRPVRVVQAATEHHVRGYRQYGRNMPNEIHDCPWSKYIYLMNYSVAGPGGAPPRHEKPLGLLMTWEPSVEFCLPLTSPITHRVSRPPPRGLSLPPLFFRLALHE